MALTIAPDTSRVATQRDRMRQLARALAALQLHHLTPLDPERMAHLDNALDTIARGLDVAAVNMGVTRTGGP